MKRRLTIIKLFLYYKFFSKKNVILSFRANLDDNTIFEGHNKVSKFAHIFGTSVGRGTYIGRNSTLNYGSIGRFCSIGPYVECVCGVHPLAPFVSTHPAFFSLKRQAGFTFVSSQKFAEFRLAKNCKSFGIGNDVWIGYAVKIMESLTIGDGAVIAAGSVVTKDVPPFEVWGGAPAKKIKDRFPDDIKQRLLSIRWWEKDFQELQDKSDLFVDVDTFLKEVDKQKLETVLRS